MRLSKKNIAFVNEIHNSNTGKITIVVVMNDYSVTNSRRYYANNIDEISRNVPNTVLNFMSEHDCTCVYEYEDLNSLLYRYS